MQTIQTQIHRYDNYIAIAFDTDLSETTTNPDIDFYEFTVLLAKNNNNNQICDACDSTFSLTNPFYQIQNSPLFCLSHLPTELLDIISLNNLNA